MYQMKPSINLTNGIDLLEIVDNESNFCQISVSEFVQLSTSKLIFFSDDKVEVWFDLHEEGLRDVLYITLNRVPSQEQVSYKYR